MSKKAARIARSGENRNAPFEVDDRREHPFFMVDNALIQEYGPKIGVYGIAAYNVLAMYAGSNSESWPSYQTIADLMDASRPKAVKAIQTLIKYSLIRKEARLSESGDSASNRYILTKQSEWGEKPEEGEEEQGGSKQDLPPQGNEEDGEGGKQNLLGSKPDLPPSKQNLPQVVNHNNHLVNDDNHGGKQDLPRVVNDDNHGGKPRLPEQYTKNNTHLDQDPMNKNGIVGETPTTPHPDSWDEFLGVFCRSCYGHMQIHKLTEKQRGALTSEAKQVYSDGYTRADLRSWFAAHWAIKICYRNDKQLPQPHEIRSSIPILRDNSAYADYNSQRESHTMPRGEEDDVPQEPASTPALPPAPKTMWEMCIDEIKLSLGDHAYEYLQGSQLVDAGMVETKNEKGEKIMMPLYQIHLANPTWVDWLKNRALGSIRRTLGSMLGKNIMLVIVADVPEAA